MAWRVATFDAIVRMPCCHDSATARISSNPAMQKFRGVVVPNVNILLTFVLRAGTDQAQVTYN